MNAAKTGSAVSARNRPGTAAQAASTRLGATALSAEMATRARRQSSLCGAHCSAQGHRANAAGPLNLRLILLQSEDQILKVLAFPAGAPHRVATIFGTARVLAASTLTPAASSSL